MAVLFNRRNSFIMQLTALLVAILALTELPAAANAQQDANSQQAYLGPHNAARSAVGVPPLMWNATLENYARNYANSQRGNCQALIHSMGPYGENLYWGYDSRQRKTAKDAVASWVNEKVDYNKQTGKCNPGKVCGHYTQIVWKSTTQVGCASVVCNDQFKSNYFICSYSPAGNVGDQRPY